MWNENDEIQRFREYLRIPSVHPDIDYEPCLAFLIHQAIDLELPYKIYYPADPKRPIFVITWTGTNPDLPSIFLNSHMDVVPVFEEYWTHPPFAADIDEDGRIYARGAQDMKCVGMQYLAAIRSLKKNGVNFRRTIHVVFVPDEEIGGELGMKIFVKTNEFKDLNVGFSLDEGYSSPTDIYQVFYAERSIWHMIFKISGTTGHGSVPLKNTAGEKLRHIIDKMFDLREYEVKRLKNDPNLTIGDVTTINLTTINGGVQSNVVPPLLEVGFDVRLAIDVDHILFEKQLNKWCEEAGGNIQIEYIEKDDYVEPTKLDSKNLYWKAFKGAVDQLGLKVKTAIFPGGTDSQFIRGIGIPAIGFSPIINTPVLLHAHDEFLGADTYLEGIEIYKKIISSVANT